jgi:hypothetical protein
MQGTQGKRWMRKMDRDGIVIHIDRKGEEKINVSSRVLLTFSPPWCSEISLQV